MKKNRISEASGSGSAGHFKVPIVLAPQAWTEDQLGPFNIPVYKYTNAELAYEEATNDFKETPEEREKIEDKTEKLSKIDMYLKSFYTGQNDDEGSNIGDMEAPEKLIKQAVGPIKEDLAVWFGTKKKPKGSTLPKGTGNKPKMVHYEPKMVHYEPKNESLRNTIVSILNEYKKSI